MYRLFTIATFLIFWASPMMSQSGMFKKATHKFELQSYEEAKKLYLHILKKGDDAEAFRKLGYCYRALRQNRESAQYFAEATKSPESIPEDFFELGKSLMNLGKYHAAQKHFIEYREQNPFDKKAEAYHAMCKRIEQNELKTNFKIERLSFNGKHADFGAVPYDKGLVFCSNRAPLKGGIEYFTDATETALLDLFYVDRKNNGEWSEPTLLKGDVNTRFHEDRACFYNEGGNMLFTRSGKPISGNLKKIKTTQNLVIFESKRIKNNWGKSVKVYLKNSNFPVSQPWISKDGKMMIFCANLPGGQGGMDLYVTYRSKSHWQTPKNLGPNINSSGNEQYPFFDSTETLYFSSDGLPGYGGIDIFMAEKLGDLWNTPVNIGAPINSIADDFSFVKSEFEQGYFSSNRAADKQDDIYSFEGSKLIFDDCQLQKRTSLCYTFSETNSLSGLPYKMYFEWDMGDGKRAKGLTVSHCYDQPGIYTVKLNVIDSLTKTPLFNTSSYQLEIKSKNILEIDVDPIVAVGNPFDLKVANTLFPNFKAKQFWWNFGDGAERSGMSVHHTYNNTGIYSIRLGIIGENESTGRDEKKCIYREIEVKEQEDIQGNSGFNNELNVEWLYEKYLTHKNNPNYPTENPFETEN